MKGWHIGVIVTLLIGYFLGVQYPSVGKTALGKVGL